jgi:microcystin-dependent protein
MAGTLNFSLSQQFDETGAPLAGGKLYFFEAASTTPQSAYQDEDLSIEHPNPIVLDAAGRVPQFFLADGLIKIRLTSATGVIQVSADSVRVIGASSGDGGGGGSVDSTQLLQTGEVFIKYGTGTRAGAVRCNARTIGSATSGATERANADTEDLFLHLWTADSNLSVSGGRGGSAAADWAANKTIALPDARNRVIAGLGAMGGSDAARLTSDFFGATGTTLGAAGGFESQELTVAQLPEHNHDVQIQSAIDGGDLLGTENYLARRTNEGVTYARDTADTVNTAMIMPIGDGDAHSNVQPTILMTFYIKL